MSFKGLIINIIGLDGAGICGFVGYGHGPLWAVVGAVLGYFMAIIGSTLLAQFMVGIFIGLSLLFVIVVLAQLEKVA